MPMITLEFYLATLIPLGIISMVYIMRVLSRQWLLFKLPIEPSIVHFRNVLFALAIAVAIGNFVPLVIDIITVFNLSLRPSILSMTSFLYGFSLHIALILASYLIWKLYKMASRTDRESRSTDHALINEEQER